MINQIRYTRWAAITASNTVNIDGTTYALGNLARPTDAIYVGGAGIVPVVQQDGTVVNMTAPAGATLPVAAIRVNSTDLTASLLVALYR